jgi:hypothetical protein
VPDEGLIKTGRRQRLEAAGIDEAAHHGEREGPHTDDLEKPLSLPPLLFAGDAAGQETYPGSRQHGEGEVDEDGMDGQRKRVHNLASGKLEGTKSVHVGLHRPDH